MLPMAPAPRAALPLAIGAELISATSRWLADPTPIMVPIFDERFSRPMQAIAVRTGPAKRKYNTGSALEIFPTPSPS